MSSTEFDRGFQTKSQSERRPRSLEPSRNVLNTCGQRAAPDVMQPKKSMPDKALETNNHMRIGLISLLQETNTFISWPTTLREFEEHLLLKGEAVRREFAGADHEVGGFFDRLESAQCDVVPVFAARALPFGTLTAETYSELTERLLGSLRTAGPLDGLLVAPHGATVSEQVSDVDGDWLSRVRDFVGADVPIISTADPHGNLSPQMVSAVDAVVAYRTNPHVDQHARGVEAAEILLRMINGEIAPTMAAEFPPLIISIDRQCTSEEPCRSLLRLAEEIRARPGVLSCSLFLGFPYADVPEMGSSVVVVTNDDPSGAEQMAGEFASRLWEHRWEFTPRLIDVETAIARAVQLEGPVCLLDMGDNVGGGSAADGTVLARALSAASLNAFVCLYDPETVRLAEQVGPGGRARFTLGGKSDDQHGPPLEAEGTVRSLHDGRFEEPQPRHGGMRRFDQGRTAVVQTDTGLTVMLTSRRMVPFSLHQLTEFDIEPEAFQIIVAKGVNAPIAAYATVCRHLIRVNTPGVTAADVLTLKYRQRRRPMFPFEPETEWSPTMPLT